MNHFVLDWKEYEDTAVKAASEGIVLLKNDKDTLPLVGNTKVALFGRMQNNYYKSGTGSGGMVSVKHVVSIKEALSNSEFITLDEELLKVYEDWELENPFDPGLGWGTEKWSQEEMQIDDALVEKAAQNNDVAVIIIGRTAGEDRDNVAQKGAFFLSDIEEDLLGKVCKSFSKTIVLLNVGNIIDMSFINIYNPSSVLYVWQAGMYGAKATADVLTGLVNPSGSITDTVAYNISDYPSDANFGKEKNILKDYYVEDVYLGYRYFSTFAPEKVMYPFGFGLSYTSFEIVTESFLGSASGVKAVVRVTNTGDRAGKRTVLLFVNAPSGALQKPTLSLCGFEKTKTLLPGESCFLKIEVAPEFFASYDDANKACLGTGWILEKGKYTFLVGKNAQELSEAGSFDLENTFMLEALESAMAPVEAFDRMIPQIDANGKTQIGYEAVPLRQKEHLDERMKLVPAQIEQTGDRGIKLADVKTGKNTMDEFIAQLEDEDLCLLIRGEGMNSSKVTTGTASAFGGINKELIALGIPAVCCDDGPSGMRLDSGKKTFSLPNTACLACTFNKQLNEDLYALYGAEMVSNEVDTILAPVVNLRRHPLNGRNFECFSEDPFLTGMLACAQIKGIAKTGATATIKHFCANNRETDRRKMDSVVSERALRELYLRAFEMAVKLGGVKSIMTGYNIVNGTYCSANYEANTIVIHEQWGFTGIIMTDWWAQIVSSNEGPSNNSEHSIMARSQNDLYMVCPSVERNSLAKSDCFEYIKNNRTDMITRAELQRCARNILNFTLDTLAMSRLMGDGDVVTSYNCPYADDTVPVKADKYYDLSGELVIDFDDTLQGPTKDITFGILNNHPGRYKITYVGSSELGELAQIPMTVFYIGIPVFVITWNGSGGQDVEHVVEANFTPKNSVIRIHFGAAGVKLKQIHFEYLHDLKEGSTFLGD